MAEKVHELTFVSDVAGWINSILFSRPELPFKEAKIQKSAHGKRTRRDLTIFGRDGNKALTGEVKMPDALDGTGPSVVGSTTVITRWMLSRAKAFHKYCTILLKQGTSRSHDISISLLYNHIRSASKRARRMLLDNVETCV